MQSSYLTTGPSILQLPVLELSNIVATGPRTLQLLTSLYAFLAAAAFISAFAQTYL